MLQRRDRLHTAKDFQRLWRGGLVRRGRYCVIRAMPTTGRARYGFVVSGTVSKRAVTRNLIKRRLRAIVKNIPVTGAPRDVVIYATRLAPAANYSNLRDEVVTLLTTHASHSARYH